MGNALSNAGGLDGLTGYAPASGALTVDETTFGAPGRAVFVGPGGVICPGVAVTAGELLEVFAHVADSAGAAPALVVEIGASVQAVPLVKTALYLPSRGLPLSFNWYYARIAAAATGNAVLTATSPNDTLLLKPYLAAAPSTARPTVWDPGSHVNPDLQLPTWPSLLPPFRPDALPTPTTNASAFAADTNISITRDLYTQLQYDFKGQMRLNPQQYDALEQFYQANRQTFFVVEPLNDRLCIASWLFDGAPKPSANSGIWTIVEVGLHLAVG
jgi:hypothetical protein